MPPTDLTGRRLLVVEDDWFLADDLRRVLGAAGAEVLGPVSDADRALALLRSERPDAAVVDVNLGEGPTHAVADALASAGVPFVFATGYDSAAMPPAHAVAPHWEKPYDVDALVRSLPGLWADR